MYALLRPYKTATVTTKILIISEELVYLQRFISGERQEKINHVRRNDVKEESGNGVDDVTRFDATTRIPKADAEGVVVEMLPSDV